MEDQVEQYKKDNKMLRRSQRSEFQHATKDIEDELKEFRRDTNTIKALQAQVSVLTQERDSALSMWAATEKQLQKVKQEVDSPRFNQKIQFLLKEIQNMQRDYSDAIHLLEGKLSKNHEEVTNLIIINEKLKKDVEVVESQNEREKLKKEMNEFTELTNKKYKEEIGSLMKKLENLTALLDISEKEKLELSNEFERIKIECYNKLQEVIEKNKALGGQCKELHHKSYNEKLQWSEERKMLRTQIITLQRCIEQVNVNLREQKMQFPCKRCSEMRKKASNYKKIASRWRKLAHDFQERWERKEKLMRIKQDES